MVAGRIRGWEKDASDEQFEPQYLSECMSRGLERIPVELKQPSRVMRGLDPRIHLLAKKMDCRVEPSNDELNLVRKCSN
jgi:hypothetical protein